MAGDAASASADAGRVHLRLPQRAGLSAGRAADRGRPRARRALCALASARTSSPTWRSLRFIRSDFVDFLRIFRFQRDFISARAAADGKGLEIVASGPQVHVMAFEIFVLAIVNELYFRRFDRREAWAEGRKRLDAKIDRLREFEKEPKRRQSVRVLRLRRAPALLRRMASRGADHPQARGAAVLQGRLRRALRPRPRPGADRHDGARVPADLPDARRAPARLPARRARGLGPGVPRRPRHRAHRRRRHGRLPRRLRPLFRQAVRRPAPRLRRPLRLGREGARALREAAHRRQDQAPGLLRRARLREGARALPPLRRPHACSASASAPT